jgi:hypothetical protein
MENPDSSKTRSAWIHRFLNVALVAVGVVFVIAVTRVLRCPANAPQPGMDSRSDTNFPAVDIERLPDPHGHRERMHRRGSQFLLDDPEVRAAHWVERESLPSGEIIRDIESPDRAWRVYVVDVRHDPAAWGERLFVGRRQTGGLSEFVGLPYARRGYHDVCFIGSRFLAFDHTTGPAYVHHYVVDLAAGRIVIGETLWE